MAIRLADTYPAGVVEAASADYPGGSFKNETAPAAGDGTPLDKLWGDDFLGFFNALLSAAGIVPSGAPDTAVASQYLEALQTLFAAAAHTHSTLMARTDYVLPAAELRGQTAIAVDPTAAAWVGVNLSGVVPNTARFAILYVELQAEGPGDNTQRTLMCRPTGNAGAGIAAASINAGGSGGMLGGGGQVVVPVTATRLVEFKFTSSMGSTDFSVWYRVQGYIN